MWLFSNSMLQTLMFKFCMSKTHHKFFFYFFIFFKLLNVKRNILIMDSTKTVHGTWPLGCSLLIPILESQRQVTWINMVQWEMESNRVFVLVGQLVSPFALSKFPPLNALLFQPVKWGCCNKWTPDSLPAINFVLPPFFQN